jgi:hypothetical protein
MLSYFQCDAFLPYESVSLRTPNFMTACNTCLVSRTDTNLEVGL